MSNPARIVVVDDHAIVRRGLKLLLDGQPEMTVVGEAADGDEVVERVSALKPNVVIMDISMPRMNGLIATRTLKQMLPDVAVIVLTRHEENGHLEELLRAGASGYVLKQSPPAELLRAIRTVVSGGIYLDPAVSDRIADGLLDRKVETSEPSGATISERESQVLRLVAVGHSNKEIADRLAISIKTVEVHKANAMRKLGLQGRVDLIRYGVLQGWLYDS